MAIKEISDMITRVFRSKKQHGGKQNPHTKVMWDIISPNDQKSLTDNTDIIVEIMKKGEGVVFAGFGIVKPTSILKNLKLVLVGFKSNDRNPMMFHNKDTFKDCAGKDRCEITITKREVLDLSPRGIKQELQIYNVKGHDKSVSALLYINKNKQTAGSRSISRHKSSIMASKRFK